MTSFFIAKKARKIMEMVYDSFRNTWNLFNGAEWYAEGTYEQMEQMLENHLMCEIEEEEAMCPQPSSDYYGE